MNHDHIAMIRCRSFWTIATPFNSPSGEQRWLFFLH